MISCYIKYVGSAIAFACISQLSLGHAFAQAIATQSEAIATQSEASATQSEAATGQRRPTGTDKLAADIEQAFENLNHQKFGVRRAATRQLAMAGLAVLPEAERRALLHNLNYQNQCITIIALIGRDRGFLDESIETLRRLSENQEFQSAGRASREFQALKNVQMARAVRTLTDSGARVTRIGANGPVYNVRSLTEDKQIEQLRHFPKLSTISLEGSGITDACVKHLCELTNLQSLYLSGPAISATGIAQLQTLGELRRVSVMRSIPTESLKAITKLKRLTHLTVAFPVGEDELRAIASTPLSSLTLTQLRVAPQTAELMGHIKARQIRVNVQSFQNSDLLWVKDCKADSIGLTIANSKELTDEGIRSLENANVTQLNLFQTGVTEEVMKSIGTLTRLTTLSIRDSPIDDDSLLNLSELKQLRHLTLTGSKVTTQGMAAIKSKLPNLSYMRPAPPATERVPKAPMNLRFPIKPAAPKPAAPKPAANP